MYSRDSPLTKRVDSISKCCIFIHYQLKIHHGNCLREWTFQNFKCIFLKINFFKSTTLNVHNSAKNRARDLLLVSFCREFYLVWPPGLNSKPTTWYLFIWTHTYKSLLGSPNNDTSKKKVQLCQNIGRWNFVHLDTRKTLPSQQMKLRTFSIHLPRVPRFSFWDTKVFAKMLTHQKISLVTFVILRS